MVSQCKKVCCYYFVTRNHTIPSRGILAVIQISDCITPRTNDTQIQRIVVMMDHRLLPSQHKIFNLQWLHIMNSCNRDIRNLSSWFKIFPTDSQFVTALDLIISSIRRSISTTVLLQPAAMFGVPLVVTFLTFEAVGLTTYTVEGIWYLQFLKECLIILHELQNEGSFSYSTST